MANELKPCPFCGCKAWVSEHTCIKGRPTYYHTHCTGCGVSDLKHHKSTEEAIEAWNRRVEAQGHWEDDHGDYVCSVCQAQYSDEIPFMNRNFKYEDLAYCPNCGTRMRGEEDGK